MENFIKILEIFLVRLVLNAIILFLPDLTCVSSSTLGTRRKETGENVGCLVPYTKYSVRRAVTCSATSCQWNYNCVSVYSTAFIRHRRLVDITFAWRSGSHKFTSVTDNQLYHPRTSGIFFHPSVRKP
jgi:hypothetical protein